MKRRIIAIVSKRGQTPFALGLQKSNWGLTPFAYETRAREKCKLSYANKIF